MLGNEQYPVPLLLLYHTHQRHYDLVLPVRAGPTGTAKPNAPVKPAYPPTRPPGPQGSPQGDTPDPNTPEAQVAGEKEVAGLVSQAEGKASEPQSGLGSLPTLPHFITPALGQVSLSVDSDPHELADVVVVPVSQGFRPIGRTACRLLLEIHEEYRSWVRNMQQPPNLGTLKWAKGHGYPFETLLAVVGENNRGTKQSLVYQVCLRALVEGGLKGAKSIAICSLGPPSKETGKKTVGASVGWRTLPSGAS